MSVLRSPTGCGSLTNLSTASSPADFSEERNIAIRNKRKRSDDTKNEIAEMRREMSEMLTLMKSLDSNQKEFMDRITADVASIKGQISDIKSTISTISTEQVTMKSEIKVLQNKEVAIQKTVEVIQNRVENMTHSCSQPINDITISKHIITEIKQREIRSKNIVIVGIPEPVSANKDQQNIMDQQEVTRILKKIHNDCPEPIHIMRLGKFYKNKSRPIKVCFTSTETVKKILRYKKNNDNAYFKIYSDQTKQQQKYLQKQVSELKRQIENGNTNLKIKYINGTPTIIEDNKTSKN